ncbi:hypothetical protein NON08_05705 [Cetobacterium somerae]|uniref:hypothetical protein n=1 Tax=Cetobacterium sp. NK01 TaxID=2993530 RepID=UPI002115D786|nr:hypothetical protein [Cetobacterium sp. NK01]MCQ8212017.1 hypothetical protein [Cetobacterium sp. NK01]
MKKKLVLLITFICNSILLISSDTFQDKPLFPLLGEEARQRGYELPNPYGINVIYVDMKQNVDIESIKLSPMIGNLNIGKNLNLTASKAKTVNTNKLVRADIWIFPFLNVYGILGKTKGNSSANVNGTFSIPSFFPGGKPILIPIKDIDFTLKYEGTTYGVGTVLAAGNKNFFSLIDFNYTKTTLNIIEGEINALVVSPKIGYNFDFYNTKNSIWIGGMYQDISQTLKGNLRDIGVDIPGKFEVNQKSSSPWNNVIGFRTEINKSVEFTTEVGFGKRKSVTLSLGYRF